METIVRHGRKCYLIQSESELPVRNKVSKLYMDFETTSGEDKEDSHNPWHECMILGVAILFDEELIAYYAPVRHRGANIYPNINANVVHKWLKDTLDVTEEWINHNIKYDYHVYKNETGNEVPCRLVDTLSRCKLLPYLEKFNYSLDICCKDFLYTDITMFEADIKRWLPKGIKDYALVPIDDMAIYAAVDTYAVRSLNKLCDEEIPEDVKYIDSIETDIVRVAAEIEDEGMPVDGIKLVHDYVVLEAKLKQLADELGFEPHKPSDCEWFFLEKHNLPIMGLTEREKKPAFGELEIKKYSKYLPEVCAKVIEYKEDYKLFTSFTKAYIHHQRDLKVHGDHNLIVRTGRMSMRQPNMQQLSKRAKEYIIAPEGWTLVDLDFSQIEFRVIVHYINNQRCIDAYINDPTTDFHDWVAAMCTITRKPAKTVNFLSGYGGGKKRLIEELSGIPELYEGLNEDEITAKAIDVYEKYHAALPELKPTAWNVSKVLRQRKFVKTFYGRRRYLPIKAHFKAFNSVCQGTAADFMKIASVRLKQWMRTLPTDTIKLIGIVHDSWLSLIRNEYVSTYVPEMQRIVDERPVWNGITFRVPIKSGVKMSTKHWGECA